MRSLTSALQYTEETEFHHSQIHTTQITMMMMTMMDEKL